MPHHAREGLVGRPLAADRRHDGEREQGGDAERQRAAGEVERMDDNQSSQRALPRALFDGRPGHGATLKVKVPVVTCVSMDRTRQMSLYVPGGSFFSVVRSTVGSLPSSRDGPSSKRSPPGPVTCTVLTSGSMLSVKRSAISAGADRTVLPAAGDARVRSACASADGAAISRVDRTRNTLPRW